MMALSPFRKRCARLIDRRAMSRAGIAVGLPGPGTSLPEGSRCSRVWDRHVAGVFPIFVCTSTRRIRAVKASARLRANIRFSFGGSEWKCARTSGFLGRRDVRVRLSCPDHPGGPARPLRARPGRHHCRMTRGRFVPCTPRQFPRSVATSPNSSVAWVGTCRESSSSSQHRMSVASSSVLTGTPARFRVQRLGEFVERPRAWERRRPGRSSALPGVLCMTGSVEPGP